MSTRALTAAVPVFTLEHWQTYCDRNRQAPTTLLAFSPHTSLLCLSSTRLTHSLCHVLGKAPLEQWHKSPPSGYWGVLFLLLSHPVSSQRALPSSFLLLKSLWHFWTFTAKTCGHNLLTWRSELHNTRSPRSAHQKPYKLKDNNKQIKYPFNNFFSFNGEELYSSYHWQQSAKLKNIKQ